jgi:hypothetical protein
MPPLPTCLSCSFCLKPKARLTKNTRRIRRVAWLARFRPKTRLLSTDKSLSRLWCHDELLDSDVLGTRHLASGLYECARNLGPRALVYMPVKGMMEAERRMEGCLKLRGLEAASPSRSETVASTPVTASSKKRPECGQSLFCLPKMRSGERCRCATDVV